LDFGYTTANGYRLRVATTNDTTTFANSGWVNITDAPHVIELDGQAATAAGANNGSLNWWIDEAPQTGLSNIDNDTRRIDRVRFGAVAGVDATTNGTLYFNAFESRRSTYIGPLASPVITTTINYIYDPLYRLTEANYSDGRYFRYTYDAVGNRLTETKCAVLPCTTPITNNYVYDSANRLTSVNGQAYTWDNNGNLTNDGTSTYVYDAANRLTSVSNQSTVSSYQYNGLGDRLSQTVNSVMTNYVLDLNAGLTQVLSDGTNTYLYGNGRIGELQPGGFMYHLGDALGSVRQLVDGGANVTLAQSFDPYGVKLGMVVPSSVFGFAGEQTDSATGFEYLRARFYDPSVGRFTQKDPSHLEANPYLYARANPILNIDSSGLCAESGDEACWAVYEEILRLCPSCANIHRPALTGDRRLHEENIYYLREVLDNVRSGWRPPYVYL
jgi:RHS repeat-associated protein